MQRLLKLNLLSVLLLCMALSLAYADTEIILQSNDENVPTKILIADGKLYSKTVDEKIIADPVAGEIIVVDDDARKYTVIDAALVEKMSTLVSGMAQTLMSQLPPEMLEQLPPEQRQALENLNKPSASEVTLPTIKNTGKSKIVNGVMCEIYSADSSDAETRTTLCAATAKAAKMNIDDYATLIKLGDFMSELGSKFAASIPDMKDAFDVSIMHIKLPGVPMELINDDSVTQIISIAEKKVDTSDYNTEGYEEQDIGQMFSF